MLSRIKASVPAMLLAGSGLIAGPVTVQAATPGAGVHISFVDVQGNRASQLYVLGDKVRLESGASQDGGAIYDAATHTMTILMPDRQAYMVLNQQSAAEMGAQMADAEKQIEARLANLPPEQREMMKKMMAQHGVAGGGHTEMTIKDLGTSETVAGHHCKDVQIVTNNTPGLKMCVASMSSLGIPSNDVATLEAMRTDMMHLMSSMGPMAQTYSTLESVQGFAIKRDVPRRDGFALVTSTEMLKSISKGNPASSLFEIPAGYRKTSLREMMKGAH
ncbi:MAG TPA: DUF4412 domain-containing protein [Gammaproteobacteria bacterium]|nr:DUF4412 domain-containing protein [Gammaproteobacteria bacterium]